MVLRPYDRLPAWVKVRVTGIGEVGNGRGGTSSPDDLGGGMMAAIGWVRSSWGQTSVPAPQAGSPGMGATVVPMRVTFRNEAANGARLVTACTASWTLGLTAIVLPARPAMATLALSVLCAAYAALDHHRQVTASTNGLEVTGLLSRRRYHWSDVVVIGNRRRWGRYEGGVVLRLADGRWIRLPAISALAGTGRRTQRDAVERLSGWHRSCNADAAARRAAATRRHPAGPAFASVQ